MLVGLWVGLAEVLDVVEGGVWGIAFAFVAAPEVDEVVVGDLVEVALGVFARLDPLFLGEPVGVLEDFCEAFVAQVVFVHHGVLFEGLDGFLVLA